MDRTEKHRKVRPFFIEVENGEIHGDFFQSGQAVSEAPDALCIHDMAKAANRDEFAVLRRLLVDNHGIGSCSFDFLGHGSSSGSWADTTLSDRQQQTAAVIDACFDSQPLTVIAAGSGADIAISLSKYYPLANLILISPRIHRSELRKIVPGEEFDTKNSGIFHWNNSESLSSIEHFQGQLGIVNNHLDEQSCPGVSAAIYQRAIRVEKRQIIELPSTAGSLLDDAKIMPGVMSRLLEMISDVPESVLHFFTNASEARKRRTVY